MPSLEDVPLECFHLFLDTVCLARLSCVSRAQRDRDHAAFFAWEAAHVRDFGAPSGAPRDARSVRARWLASLARVEGETRPRGSLVKAIVHRGVAARVRRALEFLTASAADLVARVPDNAAREKLRAETTLQPPADARVIDDMERSLAPIRFPACLRALLALTDGQAVGADSEQVFGLLGALSVYDHVQSTYLLPNGIATAALATEGVRKSSGRRSNVGDEFLVLGGLTRSTHLFLDCGDTVGRGGVYMLGSGWTGIPAARGAPCLRADVCCAAEGRAEGPLEDSLLEWLEAGARALSRSSITKVSDDGVYAISSFPTAAPGVAGTSVAVTGDVRVEVSSVFVPRLCSTFPHFSMSLQRSEPNEILRIWPSLADRVAAGTPPPQVSRTPQGLAFAYNVRLSRDASDSFPPPPRELRLTRRRWIFGDDGEKDKVVEGTGVIGLFPSLFAQVAGEEAATECFEYCSMTNVNRLPGRMEGAFFFEQIGGGHGVPELAARIERFELEVPDFLFT
jgi:uncharacterized protein affecting Mg2+/Co2+ transport